jgi:hypothetical protein
MTKLNILTILTMTLLIMILLIMTLLITDFTYKLLITTVN